MTNTDPGAPEYEFDWQNPNSKSFDFGRVLGRSFSGLFSNFKQLTLALAIVLGFTILLAILSTSQLQNLLGDGSPEDMAAAIASPGYWGWTMLASLPAFFLTLWIQLIVVKTSFAEFTNSELADSPLRSSLKFILPMFVIAIIYTIVCTLGWIFFFVGFFFVWPGWALAGPILVHEEKGVFGSIGEAWILSKGSKRWIFLLLLILSIVAFVAYSIAMGIGLVTTGINAFSGDPTATFSMSIGQQVIYNLVFGAIGYLVYALFAAGLTAAYVEIKTMKGGLGTVGEVFS